MFMLVLELNMSYLVITVKNKHYLGRFDSNNEFRLVSEFNCLREAIQVKNDVQRNYKRSGL